ncbi:MAG: hypothetical protein A2046_12550 [Bacteroidetes bacterium GWA2_30_7]|nr:MAG: hypothetical protein A2046_12550 [Bacteroidetes bacterium GWA2_30_7]
MLKIISTSDGSNSIFNENIGESYHSVNGAIQESQHVFIDAGLSQLSLNKISIFEVGFGTGLNALLSLIYSENNSIKINYDAIEIKPLEKKLYEKLNYNEFLGNKFQSQFLKIHEIEWNKTFQISKNFVIQKINDDLKTYKFMKSYNLFYFDAFSPNVQSELWSKEIFYNIFSNMLSGGILVTYCAKGEVRRCLKDIGFYVERITGPVGKREMIRAIKPI